MTVHLPPPPKCCLAHAPSSLPPLPLHPLVSRQSGLCARWQMTYMWANTHRCKNSYQFFRHRPKKALLEVENCKKQLLVYLLD